MKVVIVGGKLQGLEAVYLAAKAGWEITLIDRNRHVPAWGLCTSCHQLDVEAESGRFTQLITGTDLIIPALENEKTVASIMKIAEKIKIPVAYDMAAFEVSSSKRRSDQLFAQLSIPAPRHYPHCKIPVIAKPSNESGSHGVKRFFREEDVMRFIALIDEKMEDWIIQEYLSGPSYSLEVLGWQGHYVTLQITEIHVDEHYDCKRVVAPANIEENLAAQFHQITKKIAASLNLTGIMDVEVIVHQGQLAVLEIDARLPSQTPISVYHSTGVNMLELIGEQYQRGKPAEFKPQKNRHVIFEHLRATSKGLETRGEGCIALEDALSLRENWYGADEAITNHHPGKEDWVATIIITGDDEQEVWRKREGVINKIMEENNFLQYSNQEPRDVTNE